jgi:hypothetical protein
MWHGVSQWIALILSVCAIAVFAQASVPTCPGTGQSAATLTPGEWKMLSYNCPPGARAGVGFVVTGFPSIDAYMMYNSIYLAWNMTGPPPAFVNYSAPNGTSCLDAHGGFILLPDEVAWIAVQCPATSSGNCDITWTIAGNCTGTEIWPALTTGCVCNCCVGAQCTPEPRAIIDPNCTAAICAAADCAAAVPSYCASAIGYPVTVRPVRNGCGGVQIASDAVRIIDTLLAIQRMYYLSIILALSW